MADAAAQLDPPPFHINIHLPFFPYFRPNTQFQLFGYHDCTHTWKRVGGRKAGRADDDDGRAGAAARTAARGYCLAGQASSTSSSLWVLRGRESSDERCMHYVTTMLDSARYHVPHLRISTGH